MGYFKGKLERKALKKSTEWKLLNYFELLVKINDPKFMIFILMNYQFRIKKWQSKHFLS